MGRGRWRRRQEGRERQRGRQKQIKNDLNTLARCGSTDGAAMGLAMPFEARAPGHVDALRAATAQRLHPHDKTHGTTNDDTDRRAAARDRQ